MQTTLLGLAIAFILALVAALVGPFLIDWNQFRPQLEAEATRIVGMPVRVTGALDARLLPAPSLRMHAVTVGGVNDLGKFRAEKLDVEFSLSSLMRGEWRATELTVGDAAVDLGLNAQGRIDMPASTGPFNLGALSIDRLNLTGRAALHDAASQTTVELDDIAFSGDVRSLAAGAMRADGNFMMAGARYPFRLSSGQTADGNGTRLRVNIDPGEKPLAIDFDGVLNFDNRSPRFDGAMTVTRPAPGKQAIATDDAGSPWRITAKLKADPRAARFEALEASYGPEQSALRLSGAADLRFGTSPSLQATLAAKQLDADRVLANDSAGNEPAKPLQALRRMMATMPQPPLPTQIDLSAEQVMLGGRPLQNITSSLRGDAAGWSIDRLELRAPGATRVVLNSGGLRPGGVDSFTGGINIDSSDPDALTNWLKGRNDVAARSQKPLRIRGDINATADRFALQSLRAEIDGGTVEGSLSYAYASTAAGSRLDADFKADRLDLDAVAGLLRSFAGPQTEWPEAGQLSLDIGRALSAGQEMRPFVARLAYSPQALTLDRLKVGEASGLMLEGGGTFNRADATGHLALNATSASLKQVSGIIAPLLPSLAGRLTAMPSTAGTVGAKFLLELARDPRSADRATARAVLDLDMPFGKGQTTIRATPALAALRGMDIDALSRTEIAFDSKLAGPGRQLVALLGLGDAIEAGDAPLTLDATATGSRTAPLRVKAKLSGADLDVDVQGDVEPWSGTPKATIALAMRRANLAPLFDLKASDTIAQNVSLASRVVWDGDKLAFEDIDSVVAGSRLRGRVGLTFGSDRAVDGRIGTDSIEVGPAFGMILGTRGRDSTEPLGRGILQGWRGQLAFQALRGILPGGAELQPVSGIIKSDGQSLSVDAVKGSIGGGEVVADMDVKPSLAGYALGARVQMSAVDGSALRYRSLAMPAGKVSLRMTLSSQGRSVSALQGALSGTGLFTIDGARIAGLDPRVFDLAIRASDSGQATDDAKLRQLVEPALSSGTISVATAQIPFGIKDGRLRVSATTLDGDGIRAITSGGYDIVADQADLRTTLTGTAIGASKVRPEIQIFAVGSPDKLDRSVDVAALSSWLALRAIDRETRRLDSLERGDKPATPSPATLSPAGSNLPSDAAAPAALAPMAPAAPIPTAPAPGSAEIPLPPRNIRRPMPRPVTPRVAVTPPATAPSGTTQNVAPLPAPIEIRPAPGAARLPRARPSTPLSLVPPNSIPSRP